MARSVLKLATMALFGLVLSSMASAMATANTVPTSKAHDTTTAITPNDLKPTECASINLTAKIAGSGTISGSAANELIVGSSGVDNISGNGGDDCILGGASGDTLSGNGGNDVILGGDGNDTINGGSGTDVCYGGNGTDSFSNCETQSQ